jgi:hypothetical protein
MKNHGIRDAPKEAVILEMNVGIRQAVPKGLNRLGIGNSQTFSLEILFGIEGLEQNC